MLGEDFLEADSDEDEDEADDNNKSDNKNTSDDINQSSYGQTAGSYMSQKAKDEALEQGYDMSKSFANKSVWSRIAVIAAGPLFNFLLAFVCAVVIVGSIGYDPCRVDVLYANSPAAEAGLQEGDVIVKVNILQRLFFLQILSC